MCRDDVEADAEDEEFDGTLPLCCFVPSSLSPFLAPALPSLSPCLLLHPLPSPSQAPSHHPRTSICSGDYSFLQTEEESEAADEAEDEAEEEADAAADDAVEEEEEEEEESDESEEDVALVQLSGGALEAIQEEEVREAAQSELGMTDASTVTSEQSATDELLEEQDQELEDGTPTTAPFPSSLVRMPSSSPHALLCVSQPSLRRTVWSRKLRLR